MSSRKNSMVLEKNRGTISNLITITEFLNAEMNKGNIVDVIYFDFKKAFDSINHHTLAKKLASKSMPYLLFKTIISYVKNRDYGPVDRESNEKFFFRTNSAVPQGSHLGPNIFNFYCHDIIQRINGGDKALFYADDTKLYFVANNEEQMKIMQESIDSLTAWAHENGIGINISKTVHMSYRRKTCKNKFQSFYYVGNVRIPNKKEHMDPGIQPPDTYV